MSRFDSFIEQVLAHEGGYVNDPDDAGGETKFGISKRSFPNEDIKNLTRDRAKELYKKNYWNPLWDTEEMLPQLAFKVFDLSVNMGGRAVHILQRALHHFAQTVKVDGKYGPATHDAVLTVESQPDLYKMYISLASVHYERIAGIKANKKFLKGWLTRLNKVYPKWSR